MPEEKMKPNIKYVRERRELNKETGKMRNARVENPDDVPTSRRDGDMEFDLPPGKQQLAGFYHEDAARLARAWPKDFKLITGKGGK